MRDPSSQSLRFAAALLTGVALVFLFYRAQPVDPAAHHLVVEKLAAIQKLDADSDSQVLKLRYLLHDNYDGLVSLMGQIRRNKGTLEQGEHAIAGQGDGNIDRSMQSLSAALAEKEALVERFKTYNAVLKNSLYYLPKSVETVTGHPLAGAGLRQEMAGLLQDILLLHIGSRRDYAGVQRQIERLDRQRPALPAAVAKGVEDVLRHGRLILAYEARVDKAVASILQSPSRPAAEQLVEAYNVAFDRSLRVTNLYRYFLLLASLLMLSYAAFAFYRLRSATQALKAERETLRKYSRALEASANSVIITDINGVIEYVNPKFSEVTGYPREEVLGQSPRLLKSGETSPEQYRLLWLTITGGEEWRGEFHNRRKDGSLFWESASIGPIRDEEGDITHFVAVKEDITKRKEIEGELRRLNENLEQRVQEEAAKSRQKDLMLIQQSRLAAMGEMIGNIAHQWRQPLNALNLTLGNIKDAHDYGELDAEYLARKVEEGKRLAKSMSSTIDDFRNFFKPDKRKARFSLKGAVDHALSLLEASLRHSGIEIAFDWEQDIELEGFPNELSQVLLNILNNAKDAIHERHVPAGRIALRLYSEETCACVSIRDNAGGIPEEIMERIFDPYFTTRKMGTGIGLYMSKMIVENSMYGEIRVRNAERGAEFTIALPLEGRGQMAAPDQENP